MDVKIKAYYNSSIKFDNKKCKKLQEKLIENNEQFKAEYDKVELNSRKIEMPSDEEILDKVKGKVVSTLNQKEVDLAKVEEIKNLVKANKYEIDPCQIAKKILR